MRICYRLHFLATTTMEYQNKQTRAWLLSYKLYIKKRWWRDKEKSESGLTSYIVLLNVQGFVRWYKGNFPGSFFILNNGLFLFFPGFFCFFFRGEDIFPLDNYRCGWNIGNAGKTSAMRVKWSLKFMQCGLAINNIDVEYTKIFR